jgi:hypothetical protein
MTYEEWFPLFKEALYKTFYSRGYVDETYREYKEQPKMYYEGGWTPEEAASREYFLSMG